MSPKRQVRRRILVINDLHRAWLCMWIGTDVDQRKGRWLEQPWIAWWMTSWWIRFDLLICIGFGHYYRRGYTGSLYLFSDSSYSILNQGRDRALRICCKYLPNARCTLTWNIKQGGSSHPFMGSSDGLNGSKEIRIIRVSLPPHLRPKYSPETGDACQRCAARRPCIV